MDLGHVNEVARTARLTAKEAAVLRRLVESQGELVPRVVLLNELEGAAPRTLDTYIRNIRKKLSDAGYSDGEIATEIGKGFIFKKSR